QYFLDNCIIFNYGMMPKNILLRKNSQTDFDLVLIDGLGDVTYFTFPNKIPYFARRRINRRWDKFIKKYL
ncbi:PhoP regulatory network YrbL family protein, partial [Aliarcobacter butzleri]|nr:PhoP regulatory network YrbL family protein [Aliarcobacter butzleri]